MTGKLVRNVSAAMKCFKETWNLTEQNRESIRNASKVRMLINSLDAYDIIPHHEEYMNFKLMHYFRYLNS